MKNILIVDDDNDLLDLVALIVKNMGMKPYCVNNSNGVVPTLEKQPFHLILMDIYLDYADGRDIARNLKQNYRWQEIPLILYSASDRISDESLKLSGCDSFLKKPFEMKALVKEINRFVAN